ncbi:histidine kinase [Geomonas sp. RF6]|uniref:sensor histidine kinase n=1 Tax=Geomonas sp. RF6 TaxID=2897342 RepID=UPI001E3F37BB|nr:histidine kinase [Geomonas sp. RF6]UFS71247.1 histidine kinase [Geomonas sp. RF6]
MVFPKIDRRYFPQSRLELLIAGSRTVFAFFSLLAIWIDPSEPSRYANVAYGLMVAYVVYSLIVALVVWPASRPIKWLPVATHAFDVVAFLVFMFFTEGATSPFFVYVTFSMLCATLRWHWRGAIYTTGLFLVSFLCLGVYGSHILHDPGFEYNRFIIRGAYLTVIAMLLGYLGTYQETLIGEIANLSKLPKVDDDLDVGALMQALLEHACTLTGASRGLAIWENSEDPWRNVAYFTGASYEVTREAPDLFGEMVTQSLSGSNFLCHNADLHGSGALWDSPEGPAYCYDAPVIDPELISRYAIRSAISLCLQGKHVQGRLFLFDKKRMTSDDLLMGRIVSHRIGILLNRHYLVEELHNSAIIEERIRLARDLHDGLLQSLAGITLKVQALDHHLPEASPGHQELRDILKLLTFEQRDMRCLIQEFRPGMITSRTLDDDLADQLRDMALYIREFWRLQVELNLPDSLGGTVSPVLGQQLYFIVRESLINCAKHADASKVTVGIEVKDGLVQISISDDGAGFPYQGRYDHADLCRLQLGPSSIRERVSGVNGTLSLDSTIRGACLDITIPLNQRGGSQHVH